MSRSNRPCVCDVSDAVHDRPQGWAFIVYLVFLVLPPFEDYLFLDVLNRFDEYEPSILLQMPIHCSNLAPKDAVNRNSQRRSLPVHCAATANYQVGEPNQVYTVDSTFGNHDFVVGDPFPPGLPQSSSLVLIARKQYHADIWRLCEKIQRSIQEHIRFGVVVMGLYGRWTHGDNNIFLVKA